MMRLSFYSLKVLNKMLSSTDEILIDNFKERKIVQAYKDVQADLQAGNSTVMTAKEHFKALDDALQDLVVSTLPYPLVNHPK